MKTKKWSFRRPRHLLARFVCLLLAIIIWLYVMYVAAPPYDETYTDIPVIVLGSDEIPFEGSADAIPSLRVLGPKAALADCDKEDIVATVSLSDLASQAAPLVDGMLYTLDVSFTTPDGISIEGAYTVSVLLKHKS